MEIKNDELIQRFKNFYSHLNKKNIFYMFFTSKLLLFVKKNLMLLPKDINLIFLASQLKDDEKIWLQQIQRPIFYIDDLVDDRYIWKLLVLCNDENFGWIDIDCFIFNPKIFDEITCIDNNTTHNCVWSFSCANICQYNILHTYIMFFNINAYRNVNKISPIDLGVYIYPGQQNRPPIQHNIFNETQVKLINKIMPANSYPRYRLNHDQSQNFFDTHIAYQLIASTMGYKINLIRDFDDIKYYSDEAIHISSVSYFYIFMQDKDRNSETYEAYKLALFFSYHLLSLYKDDIPQSYRILEKQYIYMIKKTGTDISQVRDYLYNYFVSKGISSEIIDRLLN